MKKVITTAICALAFACASAAGNVVHRLPAMWSPAIQSNVSRTPIPWHSSTVGTPWN